MSSLLARYNGIQLYWNKKYLYKEKQKEVLIADFKSAIYTVKKIL